MGTHPLLECDDFDALIDLAVEKAREANSWTPTPLPAEAHSVAAILATLESDCRTWEVVLCQLLVTISLHKQAFGSLTLLLKPPEQPNLDAITTIQFAPYLCHLEQEEVRSVMEALQRLWNLYKENKKFTAEFSPGWKGFGALIQDLNDGKVTYKELGKLTKHEKLWLRKLQAASRSPRREYVWNATGLIVKRAWGLQELRNALGVMRDIFSATDALRKRIVAKTGDAAPQFWPNADRADLPAEAERARIEAEAKTCLSALGVDPGKSDRLRDAQLKYIIWFRWRHSMEPAKIRDKWNSEFPLSAIQGEPKAATAHVRTGMGRAEFLIDHLKAK